MVGWLIIKNYILDKKRKSRPEERNVQESNILQFLVFNIDFKTENRERTENREQFSYI